RPIPARRVGARVISAWRVGVVVPARDEELLLGRCLTSVREAVACSGMPSDHVRVVVVADACRDATATLARRLLRGWGEVLEIDRGNAGWARREGAQLALDRFAMLPRRRLWLANTDADSAVPWSWLAEQLQLADAGAAAVAGVVGVDSFREHPPLVR